VKSKSIDKRPDTGSRTRKLQSNYGVNQPKATFIQNDKVLLQEKEDILKQYQTFYEGPTVTANSAKKTATLVSSSSYHSKKASSKKSPQMEGNQSKASTL
jgi:hypothetical protein